MKLKKHHRYQYTDTAGTVREVLYLCRKGKGHCKIVNFGTGPGYQTVATHRLTELPTAPKQTELFA